MKSSRFRSIPYFLAGLLLLGMLVIVLGGKNLSPLSEQSAQFSEPATRPLPSLDPIRNSSGEKNSEPEKVAVLRVEIPTDLVQVIVQDESGLALADSTISAPVAVGGVLATADDRGRIELPDSTLTKFEEAVISHPGFVPILVTSLSLRESHSSVVTLARGASLDLIVLDQDYNPLEGVSCLVSSTIVTRADAKKLTLAMDADGKPPSTVLRDGHIFQVALTNSSGRAAVSGMPPGGYNLQAYHPDFITTDINAGPTLPTVAQVVMTRPAVILAELEPSNEVVWWRVKMPSKVVARGYAQRSASQLQDDLRAAHPNAVCVVGVGGSGLELPEGIIRALFKDYGWQTIPLSFRPYTEGMQPLKLRPNLKVTSPMGRVRIAIATPSKDNPLSSKASEVLFRVATVNNRERADMIRSIPVRLNEDFPLPYGTYQIVSASSIIPAGTKEECEFQIDSKSLVEVSLKLRSEIATVRFAIVDGEGRRLERGLIAIEADGRRTSKIFNEGMSNATFWCPQGEGSIRVEAVGYLPVEKTISVNGDGPFVVAVECKYRR